MGKLEELGQQLQKLQTAIAACTSVARLQQYGKLAMSLLRQYRDLHKSARAEIRTWDKLANSEETWLRTPLGSATLPQSVIRHVERRRAARQEATAHPQDASEMSGHNLDRQMFSSSPDSRRRESEEQRRRLMQKERKKSSSARLKKINWNG